MLFSDPPESSEIVSIYHEFHEIYGASITVEWIGGGPPNAFRMSAPVLAVSSRLLNSLVAKGGAILTGRTETGQPFLQPWAWGGD